MPGYDQTVQEALERVLALQADWSSSNSPAMKERGELVRSKIPADFLEHRSEFAIRMGIPGSDFHADGRDGTGRKAKVPWARFSSFEKSPTATDGFYVVYLFSFPAGSVFLSLNQGTTDFVDGEYKRKPERELEQRVSWARQRLGDWTDLPIEPLELGPEAGELAEGYELGNIAALRFAAGSVPSDHDLFRIELLFASALGRLYQAHESEPLPFEAPEVRDAEAATHRAAGKRKASQGAGFNQSAAEREAIEEHAVSLVTDHLEKEGWAVRYEGKGGKKPYDLRASRGSEEIFVEVKGTSSDGRQVVLTAGEVAFQRDAHPANALFVVSGIRIGEGSSRGPEAKGGKINQTMPWEIEAEALTPISFKYTAPLEPD